MYDLIIIGGGPAGTAAGVYAARKKIKTLIITENFGGQSIVSGGIENWIGSKNITGLEFSKMLEEHVRAQEGIEIKMPDKVKTVSEVSNGFEIETDKGNVYQARALIVASGIRRKRLDIPGEEKFSGKGVFNCSTCDAPIFKNKAVAVVGGGNSGLETVIDLTSYAKEIYLINRGPKLRGDSLIQEKIKKYPKITIINNAEIKEIIGDKFVSGVKYLDKESKQIKEMKVDGVFVEIGFIPNSEFLNGLVNMNNEGEIIIDPKTSATSRAGIFAAGAITDEIFNQNNIAAGEGVIAALSAYNYLINK
jgi:alkyl hydroperoxide reductase subunit F